MSFINLRPYFEERMLAVDLEFNEWEDAFNIENIPSTRLDKAWHFELGAFTYSGTAHTCLSFNCPVRLRVFVKGYRNPKEAVDLGTILSDAIVKEACKPSNRLNQPYIKNVLPSVINIQALTGSNDNVALLDMTFNCEVLVKP